MSRLQNLNSLRVSNIDVAFATAFGTLLSGAFLVGFMKTLGASDLWINLLAALPSLVGVLQIPGGILGRGVHSYKRFVAPGGLLWRIFYIPFLALPLLAWSGNIKLLVLVVCVTIASIATTFVGPVYNDWIAELIPSSSRGFWFARRNAIAAIVGAVIGILGAVVLDRFRAQSQEKLGFTVVFAIGLICGTVSWIYFDKMDDLVRPNPERQTLREGIVAIKRPFADRRYLPVLVFLAMTMVGQGFAGNLIVAYARESLHLDYQIIQGAVVFMALGNVAAATGWGFLADRFGNKPMLVICGIALALNPIFWILCIPDHPGFDTVLLFSGHFYMGIVWAGINLCQFNVMLETADPEDRANYLGAGTTVTALSGGIAPLVGGAVMELCRAQMPAIAAYRWILVASVALRLLAVFFLAPVREPGSSGVRTALKDMSGVSVGGVRTLRTLTRSSGTAARESAIERAGEIGIGLAADEIIKSLHDPLPRIRRQAATALSKLNDERAVEELIHQINEHPDLLEEETINALGAVGNVQAVPPLTDTLSSPRPLIRRAAARALGQIGSRLRPDEHPLFANAERKLVEIAQDPHDPDLRRAALQAMRYLGSDIAHQAIVTAVLDQWPSVRIAATEAIEELQIKDAADNLRESLRLYSDEACAEAAYCLSVVGDRSDIPVILGEAARSVSIITRRRCLLGLARLFDVEHRFYRLLLLSDMSRDNALQEILKPRMRRDESLRTALDLYSTGDEPGAVAVLAERHPALSELASRPVDELFLVAALAAARE